MKTLCILRHSYAEEQSLDGRDEQRTLSLEGEKHMERVTEELQRQGVALQVILHSPYVRTRQTAEILQRSYGQHVVIQSSRVLLPGAELLSLEELIKAWFHNHHVIAMVGHMPYVQQLFEYLDQKQHRWQGFSPGDVAVFDILKDPQKKQRNSNGLARLRFILHDAAVLSSIGVAK